MVAVTFTFDFKAKSISDVELAEYAKVVYGSYIISQDKKLYYWNNVYWDSDGAENKLFRLLSGQFYNKLDRQLNKQLGEIENIDKLKKGKSALVNKLKSNIALVNIMSVCAIVFDRPDIVLDNNPDIFCFTNKVYNLSTLKFIQPCKSHYITQTTGYEYKESTQEEVDGLLQILKTILPIEDERNYFLAQLATGLNGHQNDKFVMANNSGGNGKNVVFDLMLCTVGDYGLKGLSACLQETMKNGGNPAIAAMHKKRFVLFSEPDRTKALCCAVIKELTGDGSINARMLYSNDIVIRMCASIFTMCNDRPRFDETNDAIHRRLVDIPFRSSFKTQEDIDKITVALGATPPHLFLANPYYVTREFQAKMKCAFFNILMQHYTDNHKVIKIPKSIRDRGTDFLNSCDEFYTFFDEYFERVITTTTDANTNTDQQVYISIAEIIETMRFSRWYTDMDKRRRRTMTKKWIIDYIEKHTILGRFYRLDFRPYDHGEYTHVRNVVIDFKARTG